MASTISPTVFISYAWESDIKEWVRELATRLRSDGVRAILDQWEVELGDLLPEFMENSVSASNYVLVICTPLYKSKSESSHPSGVGYEKSVITGELFVRRNQRKFIPVLRKGSWVDAAPSWALGKIYIDLKSDPLNENSYRELLRTLYGKREPLPPLGTQPDFSLNTNIKSKFETSINIDKIKNSLSALSKNDLLIIYTVLFPYENLQPSKGEKLLETIVADMKENEESLLIIRKIARAFGMNNVLEGLRYLNSWKYPTGKVANYGIRNP